jgi:ATP-dependent Clp protease adapter protein ClpS
MPLLSTTATPDVETDVLEETTTRVDAPWRVLLFDDDTHTFDEVIVQLVRATGCSWERAETHAWTVHSRGKDTVFSGPFEQCFRVQQILNQIELITQLEG